MRRKTSGLRGVAPPRQDRSRDTYERVLSAAESLLRARDFGALRIEDLLAEAGVSTGSFYARFEDKGALLRALIDRYREDLVQLAAGSRGRGGPVTDLEEAARLEARHRVRRFQKRAGLIRTVVLEHRRDPETCAELTRLTRQVNARIVDLFRPCFDQIGHADPERAVLYGSYFVGAVCRDRLLFGRSPHAASVSLPVSRLEDELTVLLASYLRGGSAASARSSAGGRSG